MPKSNSYELEFLAKPWRVLHRVIKSATLPRTPQVPPLRTFCRDGARGGSGFAKLQCSLLLRRSNRRAFFGSIMQAT
jgi:hypothetical protein